MTSRNLETTLNSYSPAVLSLFRVVIGFLFAIHGAVTLFAWPMGTGSDGMGPAAPVGAWPGWWSGLIELVTGLLVMVGLFTRAAAFLASGTMAVAFFWIHLPHGLMPIKNGGEPAVMFCFSFFLLVFTGGGSYALDAARRGTGVGRATGRRRFALGR
jgi:putative oxidoreductase